MKLIASWIRDCDEEHFRTVFLNYPQVRLINFRTQSFHWENISGLLLTGGSDLSEAILNQPVPDPTLIQFPEPERDRLEVALLKNALTDRLPILAICRGLQLLNVYLGGTLNLHIDGHDNDKYTNIQPLIYAPELNPTFHAVNSSHHQCLAELGAGLVVEARCATDGVIEQARLQNYPFALGVQFHPERDPLYRPLFNEFVAALEPSLVLI